MLKIGEKIYEIEHEIGLAIAAQKWSIGLFGGYGGMALFLFYLGKVKKDKRHKIKGNEVLYMIFEELEATSDDFSFSTGLSGIGWLLEHLKNAQLIDLDTDDLLNELDDQIFDVLIKLIGLQNNDFMAGSMGCLNYLLKRGFFNNNIPGIEKVLQSLEEHAIKNSTEVRWNFYNIETRSVESRSNFGISHGMPSILLLLSNFYKYNYFVQPTILNKAINFIDKCHREYKNHISLYPYEYPSDNRTTRMGWCYGDMGVALMYLRIGKNINNLEYLDVSEKIMKNCANRKSYRMTEVYDAGLCHGSAGIFQIFKRFYWDTGNSFYDECARFWIVKTIEQANHQDGPAGFKQWNHNNTWVDNYGLLEGISGIGLALLSELSKEPLAWDECLLIS